MTKYYKLLDENNKNKIVKADGRLQYEFDKINKEWIRSGILLDYFSDESETFEMYEEISEAKAKEVIS